VFRRTLHSLRFPFPFHNNNVISPNSPPIIQ
jgi:hypothetical protein